MAQITSGVRAILNHPRVYHSVQAALGAHRGRTELVRDFIRARPGDVVLDIGCGPAEILAYLPEVDYWGFDISAAYIEQARRQFPHRTHFFQKVLATEDAASLPKFDLALALGVFHHLDDETARQVLVTAARCLKPGGRVVSIDPCFEPGQNPLARFLISRDRGQNVRTRAGYGALVPTTQFTFRSEVRHRAWIPYTHCYLECVRK